MFLRAERTVLLMSLVLLCTACGRAKIDDMVAGANIGTGELECWLELEFGEAPEGIDPKNVRVVFSGEAVDQAAEFDWTYIAERDVIPSEKFGGGHSPNASTSANEPPPAGQKLKVKFPLQARRQLYTADASIWVEADLYWGGEHQDSSKRDVSRLWQDADAKHPNPWSM